MFGSQKKALGAVMIDLSDSCALVIAAFMTHFVISSFYGEIFYSLLFFFFAIFLQKHVEIHGQKILEK